MEKRTFELTKDKQAELKKKIQELKEFCTIQNIPFFCSAAVSDNGETTVYEGDIVLPYNTCGKLSQDRIAPMLLVMNGFPVAYEGYMPDKDEYVIDLDDEQILSPWHGNNKVE